MKRSRYDNRAKFLNAEHHRQKAQLPIDIPREEYWAKYVKSRQDVETFYSLYYPELPEVLVRALADYFTRAVDGQIELPPEFTDEQNSQRVKWDYKAEMLEEMNKGKTMLALKKMEELMKEEEDKKND